MVYHPYLIISSRLEGSHLPVARLSGHFQAGSHWYIRRVNTYGVHRFLDILCFVEGDSLV